MKYSYNWTKAFDEAKVGERELLDEHIGKVYNMLLLPYFRLKCNSEEIAHDICITVITKFWERFYIKKEPLPNNVNGYLYTMANNGLYHHTKLKKKQIQIVSFLDSDVLKRVLEQGLSKKEMMDTMNKEGLEFLYYGLDKSFGYLGEKCKEILRLKIIDKKRMKEIAKIMGFPTDNAASQKKISCMNKLKELMHDEIRNQEK